MCFTVAGRIQTRLLSLVGPLALALVFAAASGERDYLTLFGVMVLVVVALDLSVYAWLIGFQARWLSIILAAVEFWLVKAIVELPFPRALGLRTRQALLFYLLAWCLSWITTQMVLPLAWPRWSEDGGEIRPRIRPGGAERDKRMTWLAPSRRSYGTAVALLTIGVLPWVAGIVGTPAGQRFTGLLWLEAAHLDALEVATAAMQGTAPLSPASLIGSLAQLGHWPLLPVYWGVWLMTAFIYLLGLVTFLDTTSFVPVVALGLPPLVLPAPWMLFAAGGIWLLVLMRADRPGPGGRGLFARGGALIALGGWLVLWARLGTAPYAYVDEGTWQLLAWVRQSTPPAQVTIATRGLNPLVSALAGRKVLDEGEAIHPDERVLVLANGAVCESEPVIVFRYGEACAADRLLSGTR